MRFDFHFTRLNALLAACLFLAACPVSVGAQQATDGSSAPTPDLSANSQSSPLPSASVPAVQTGSIGGTVTDAQDDVVPGAEITLDGQGPGDSRKTVANDLGAFQFDGIKPKVSYHITIRANGFVDWKSDSIALSPGEYQYVPGIRLELNGEATSVTVHGSSAELAVEQVRIAEEQRILGIVPNFYVAYDKNAPPLDARAKFQLALRVSADPITIAGVLFMAGVNQGVRIPDYRLGAEGYGERVGSVAADGFTDIFFGGAVLPAILHQDPRYFYQGTGTKKSRLFHALAGPFVCRGDNGHMEPNYSTVGGDIVSAGFSNLYYPRGDRTWMFFGENVMISTIERTASTVTQEFVLNHLTSKGKNRHRASTDVQ